MEFKDIAIKLLKEVNEAIKAPVVITDAAGEIIAANSKETLPAGKLARELWQEEKISWRKKALGAVWLKGQGQKARIYAELLKTLLLARYKDNLLSVEQLKQQLFQDLLDGSCSTEALHDLLRAQGLKADSTYYFFVAEFDKSDTKLVLEILANYWQHTDVLYAALEPSKVAWILSTEQIADTPQQDAAAIQQLLLNELYIEVRIGLSGPSSGIANLAATGQEAQLALEMSRKFGTKAAVADFHKLNLLRFLAEVPQEIRDAARLKYSKIMQALEDHELSLTLEKILEHNLNLSEASRELYIHRNTLLYRMEKLQKITGLDFKSFDDIVLLRLLMLLHKQSS